MGDDVGFSMNRKNVILVVEDDAKTHELTRAILEESGYSVLSAYDWQTACETINNAQPDLVLLDLMLPDSNGGDTCWKIGKDNGTKNIPVIVCSSMGQMNVKLSTFLAGARRFLSKPFSSDELIVEVEKALRGKYPCPICQNIGDFQRETDEHIKRLNSLKL